MTHRDAFLQAIIAAPDDDNPRFQFADWLDENGDGARAEFIRVQCELAKMGIAPYGIGPAIESFKYRRDDLHRRERELFCAWDSSWFPDFPGPCVPGLESSGMSRYAPHAWLRRGFVEHVTCSATDFLAHADALTAVVPLRKVTLTTWPGEMNVQLSNRINTLPRPRIRWQNGKVWIPIPAGWPSGPVYWIRELLEAEWPRIKFTLPTQGEDMTSSNDLLRQIQNQEE